MRNYSTEAEVISIISQKLLSLGTHARVSIFSDTQSPNSVERKSIFKAAVSAEESETVINGMADIGTETDRGIFYNGSQVEATESGEIRFLFFGANINPYEEN